MTSFPSTKHYVEAVTKHIIRNFDNRGPEGNINMPIIHKIIKLREALKMSNDEFRELALGNPRSFKYIFFETKYKKDVILGIVASKDSSRILPFEYKVIFTSYIFDSLNDMIKAKQCHAYEIEK
jgi:hypothetical protein